jgi:hypothetical protein
LYITAVLFLLCIVAAVIFPAYRLLFIIGFIVLAIAVLFPKRFYQSLVILLCLIVVSWLLLQTGMVQNWLVGQASGRLSKSLGTKVTIKHVDFSFFNKMEMEGTYIEDRHKDTLLYAGKLKVRITDWFFLKDTIRLEYIGLEDAVINMNRRDSIWNYAFIADYFSSGAPTDKKKKGIDLGLKEVELSNIHFLQRDGWRGEDMSVYLRALKLDANEINFNKKLADVNELKITEPIFSIYNYKGNRPARPPTATPVKIVANAGLIWNSDEWRITATDFTIINGTFKNNKDDGRAAYYYFDGHHLQFNKINASFKNFSLVKDTIRAKMSLSTKERSGLEVKSFKANMKWYPKAMEFANLDIRTNKSRLTNFFSMRYNDFGDMDNFEEKVNMQGNFKDAIVHSDDIAFFAPDLADWKKEIHLTGAIRGTIENLTGKGLVIRAGNNTVLNGDIAIKGLSQPDKTFIYFKSKEFRTTYTDAVTIIPELKDIKEPRLDRLEYLRFTGTFTGYIRDFLAQGTIETALGTVHTDVNMKFPKQGSPVYSGKVETGGFKLGSFLDNQKLGNITFNGTVKGSSFVMKNMQANLDGNISSFEFNGYTYQNIKVKGTLAKRLFNGELIADDPNVSLRLNGLVDLNEQEPRFNFFASIDKANMKRLKLYQEDIDFNGNFRFDFTGDNIDDFLGSAKIYDASVYKNGRRISFDSLSIESKKIENSKSIVIVSNEFDAALVGEFSIRELPAAFQTFLNRYYPSYIKPSTKKLTNENFSFVITTKKVDEYLDLFDKNIKGFNNTNLSGRINTKENLFDLDAEVPQFSYKNIAFYNVNLQGRGTIDSIALATSIGEVFINDSLHFPGTKINIRAGNDVSKINITTSANQTLNSASISGTLHTMQNGFNLVFDPSTFDVNGKKWTIDNGGELTLVKDMVTTDGLKIYSGDQQVFITSHPSEIGNGSDLGIELKKINIGDFTPFFLKGNRMEGLLTGRVDIANPFGKMNVDVKAEAEQFRFDDDSIGKLQLNSSYSAATGRVNVDVVSNNQDYNFDVKGFLNINDSSGTGIDLSMHPRRLSIKPLGRYVSGIFSNVDGFISGDLQLVGKGDNLKYLGNLTMTDASLLVDYTQCLYHIPKATIRLLEDRIDFGNFQLKDDLKHAADVQTAKLYHSNFKDMAFDFRVRTNSLLLLNTTAADNKQFYGKAIGKADFRFSGPQENMEMQIVAEPTDSSSIYLPTGSASRVKGEAPFLTWKVYGTEMQQVKQTKSESNLSVKLKMTANKFAKMNVILDEAAGDQIEAVGHGTIDLTAGTREDLTLNGKLDIDQGDYTFTFQSIKREFKLRNDANNFIQWSGDPYNADLNVTAEYTANNVRFSDLGDPLVNANENLKRQPTSILVIAKITEKLQAPKIVFDIELPPGSALGSDPNAGALLQKIKRDENELNKQVSLLVVFNSFGPMSSSGQQFNLGRQALEGIVVNSISGLISNELTRQFSSIFQNVFKDPTIRVNVNASLYSGANASDLSTNQTFLDRSNVNFSINKSYFNERLTFIVGSAIDFGLTNNTATGVRNSFQFLPDVTAQYKLTPDGKFLLNFFYRQNTNYYGGGTSIGKQSRSGASVSYRKNFDTIDELFKKKKKKPVNEKGTVGGDQ